MLQDSSIILRIRHFLQQILPFSYFSHEDLQVLASRAEVAVYKNNSIIFNQGDQPKDRFYVVKKGAVDITSDQAGTQVLMDKCGEGDMFGIRPLLAESPYLLSATASEDSIIYLLPLKDFKEIYGHYRPAVDYMVKRFAAGRSIRDTYSNNDDNIGNFLAAPLAIKPALSRTLVTIGDGASVGEAISKMNEEGVSSIIIINEKAYPRGILTDTDIRKMVAVAYDPDRPVKEVMSHPVHTISSKLLLQEIQLTMIESGLHHMCVTEDGTANSKGLGMVTEHDILYANASDPVVILKKIKRAKRIDQLIETRKKIDHLLPNFLSDTLNNRISQRLIDKLNHTLIQKCVQIALAEYNIDNQPIAEDDFAFYNMGSAARGEQLLMTDQDNGIIFQDKLIERRADFLMLAKVITDKLHQIGYEYCPAHMMASNPNWCKSISEMKQLATNWVLSPGPEEVLSTSIFFDFRYVFGNENLVDSLKDILAKLLVEQDSYIRFLAKQAISNPPPLSFFRKFIIEKNGEHKDQFDIKLRAIAPLSDLARVLSLNEGYFLSSSTVDRYEHMKTIDEANAPVYDEAINSYLDLLQFRLAFALENQDSGRYIGISALNKMERMRLRNSFNPTRKLMDTIERKFRLAYL